MAKSSSYIDFTRNISYKKEHKLYNDPDTDKTKECSQLIIYLTDNVSQINNFLNKTEDASQFFKQVSLFKEFKLADEEAFYQIKLGFKIDGVPSRLVYILKKAINIYGTENPNLTLQSVYKLIDVYNEYYFSNDGNDITLSDIIFFLFREDFKLITPRRLISGNEVYIKSQDRIAVIPEDILSKVRGDIEFSTDPGMYGLVGNIDNEKTLLRTYDGRLGVTRDDFDLRDVF